MSCCTCIGGHAWSDRLGHDRWVLAVPDPDCPVAEHMWLALGAEGPS